MTATEIESRMEFVTALFEGCEGLLELRALPSERRTFVGPTDAAGITRFLTTQQHENLYFGVATRRDSSSGKLHNCRHLGAAFADVDFKTVPEDEARARLQRFPLRPSLVVHSGGGLHVYYLLKEPLVLPDEADHAKQLLRRLAVALGGDLTAAEPARVLRVPGTWNYKPEYGAPRLVRVEGRDADAAPL